MKYGSYASNVIHKINSAVMAISLLSLLIMVFFVTVDVIGRYLFNKPITGGMEIQELMMVVIVFLAMGVATQEKTHVIVELLIQYFKGRTLTITNSITGLISFAFVALLVWQTLVNGFADLRSPTGTATPILDIRIVPFIFIAALGLLLMALEIFIDVVENINRSRTSISKVSTEVTAKLNDKAASKQGVTQDG